MLFVSQLDVRLISIENKVLRGAVAHVLFNSADANASK